MERLDWLPLCALFVRSLGAVVWLPWGEIGLSPLTKFLCAVAITAGGVPAIVNVSLPDQSSVWALPIDFVLGSFSGVSLALALSGARMLGELIDIGRGQSIAASYDPMVEQELSPSAVLLSRSLFTSFVMIGGFTTMLGLFYASCCSFPPAQLLAAEAIPRLAIAVGSGAVQELAAVSAAVLPWMFVGLAIDLTFGFISQAVPSLSLQSEAFLVKTLVGMLLLARLLHNDLHFLTRLLPPALDLRL